MYSQISICQILPPPLQLQDKSMVPLLLHSRIIGSSTFNSMVCINWYTKGISCAQDLTAYSSAYITDRVMTFLVELLVIMGESFRKPCVLDTLFLSSGLVA